MKDFNLEVSCSICAITETITSSVYERNIYEVMSDAYQTDKKRIDPYFKIAKTVLSGKKGEVNWESIPVCEQCRARWAALEAQILQQLSSFKSGDD